MKFAANCVYGATYWTNPLTLFRLAAPDSNHRRESAQMPPKEESMMMKAATVLATCVLGAVLARPDAAQAEQQHAIAMHGAPALPADYTHFPYANPDAPKGGSVTFCVIGTFDNLNPFILNSMRTTARMMNDSVFGSAVFEPLMQRSYDEAFTMYGHIAEKVETDPDRTWVEFTLNPLAKWSDGEPITPEDVIFSYETYTAKGRPPYNSRMNRVEKLEKTGDNTVRFTFNDKADREFPLIIALTPIIPKHATDAENFDKTTLTPLIGSGPYVVDKVSPGERISFKRNPDYWGKDLPEKKGFDNYDTVTIDYFRDNTSRFEAFKKGLCDVMPEEDPARWDQAYDFPAVQSGDVIKGEFDTRLPAMMIGMVFNTRRPVFADTRVRRAVSMLYDFEWVNQNIYLGKYHRTGSFWQNSELSALGRPASEHEKELLAPYMDEIQPDVIDGTYKPTQTDASGRDREVLRAALNLLGEAGYKLQDRKLVGADGKPLEFEFLVGSANDIQSDEKLALVFQRAAEKLGITVNVRKADDAQLQQRRQTWDYDMIMATYSASLSPGIEQSGRWGSAAAAAEGTFNYAGASSKGIDAMIQAMVDARDRGEFVDAVRALDRLLISGHYVIPMQNNPAQWIAYWKRLKHPDYTSAYGYQMNTWWIEE